MTCRTLPLAGGVTFAVLAQADAGLVAEVPGDVLDAVETGLGRDFPDSHVGADEELHDVTDTDPADFLMNRASQDGLETLLQKTRSGAARAAIRGLSAILPDLENFNFKAEVVHGLAVDPKFYFFSALYALAYTLFILALAILIFKKRDFV